jgi:peroxiredoxin
MAAVNSHMLPLGTVAPGFSLADPSGTVVSSDDVAGARVLVVAFLSNHCPYVRHIAERLGAVADEVLAAGGAVVGIMSNDTDAYPDDAPERMATAAAAWGWRFPYLVDADQTVAHAYRAACTPDFFVFDGDRRLVYRGRFDAARPSNDEPVTGADLLAATRAVLAGEAVPGEQLPSLGCSIKWRPGNEPAP